MDSCYILSIFLWQLYGNFVGLSSHVIVVMTIILFIMCEHVCFGTRNRMEILYFIENPIKKIMHSFPRTNKNFVIPYFFQIRIIEKFASKHQPHYPNLENLLRTVSRHLGDLIWNFFCSTEIVFNRNSDMRIDKYAKQSNWNMNFQTKTWMKMFRV